MCNESLPSAAGRPVARGFTLIELMITVAIIALLAAVAYPSYESAIRSSRRAEAKSALTEAAQRLERYYTENNKYAGARFCSSGTECTPATRVAEEKSENGHYALAFAGGSLTTTTFIATATAQGAQAGDVCDTLTLDQAGRRRAFKGGVELTASKCW